MTIMTSKQYSFSSVAAIWSVSLLFCTTIRCPSNMYTEAHKPLNGWFRTSNTMQPPQIPRRIVSSWRGGDQEELTLDQKVQAAMKKLGLEPPPPVQASEDCEDGVCSIKPATNLIDEDQVVQAAEELAASMKVDRSLAMAALSATSTSSSDDSGRKFDKEAASSMIQQELDMIEQIPVDSPEVQTLVEEGFDPFFVRRALAFAEGNSDDARAILLADQEDEEQEEQSRQSRQSQEPSPKQADKASVFPTVTVDSNIDPTQLSSGTEQSSSSGTNNSNQSAMPKPANKADVVFEATTAQIQELVLESPVPVLLDVYADWCGPCKALTPALEEMAQKSGGIFRLVKVNSDNEKPVSTALEVTALPTVLGIKDGKVVHMFQGMPRSEDAMKNFMMGLLMGEKSFDPPLTKQQKDKYQELTTKLVKMAGAACFSFSARERLQDRVATQLETLVEQVGNDASKAEESARVVRSLLSNIIRNPTEAKYRTIKLSNSIMSTKITPFSAALGLLKSVGFQKVVDGPNHEVLKLAERKKFVNVAPLTVARDAIDKWVDQSRYEIAKAARKRKDEEERQRLIAEGAFDQEEEDEEEEDISAADSLDTCHLRVRIGGKKKVHSLSLAATDSLSSVLSQLSLGLDDNPQEDEMEEIQITCVAKKLVVKSTDKETMEGKTLAELGLVPKAALVVDIRTKDCDSTEASPVASSKLLERAALQKKKKKKGSQTMQTVGIYSKDDNAKGELVDGGGGVLFEQDVSDDEEDEDDSIVDK